MSRIRYLADEDLRRAIMTAARRMEPHIEFVTAASRGLSGRPDDQVLEIAAREGLAVVSHDRRTMTAAAYSRLARSEVMPGLFIIPRHHSIRVVVEDLVTIWGASEA